MKEPSSIEEMEAVLTATPTDHALRRDLIDLLLTERQLMRAEEHFDLLAEQLPEEPWVVKFGIEVMTVTGDTLKAARLRKRWRELEEMDDDADDAAVPHPGHPSQDKVSVRHLSLVRGTGEFGERHDGVGFRTELRLDDVAGLATVKARLRRLIADRDSSDGVDGWPGGALLYGPPSCGKAFFGEVVAGELGSSFWYVDLEDSWDQDALEEVIASATEQGSIATPAVLYLDNLDAISHGDVNAIIPALEDSAFQRTVITLGAATYPWKVSAEVLRPGRLGEVLLVLPPDAPARRTFLQRRLAGRAQLASEDLDWVVQHTEGHSFEDLERLIDLALLTDGGSDESLSHQSLRAARQRINSSSSEWLTTAGHHAMMGQGGGLYDDLIAFFTHRQKS